MDPAELKYAKTHEWIQIDGDTGTIGISDFAVNHLTDLVYIDLPEVGRNLTAGESFGEVESVKAVSDLYSPVAGEIVEVNAALADDLGILSDDPFAKGWMIKLKISDASQADGMLDRAAYDAHCASEDQ